MSLYLLDTNAVSALINQPEGIVAQRAGLHPQGDLCTSVIVVAELRYGAAKRRSPALVNRMERTLDGLPAVPFESPAEHQYAELRVHLERAGTPISYFDMLIAAHALSLGCILVTDNEREFRRVPGLTVENWQRHAAP
ncbi:MAG: type II toxin-antitoxin system VapC family toxin [Caulobacteraceae bacterium]|nr:MAG: type II toxin-antitoxin system VapC family toxin [Caulobacteraceae bacterium]